MRIGIDARMYSSEFGIGVYIAQLLEYLFRVDHRNEYFLFTQGQTKIPAAPRSGVKIVPVDIPHYSLSEQLLFPRILRRHKLDLMHFTHFNAPLLYRRPSVVTIHDLTVKFFPGKKITSPLARAGYHMTLRSIIYRSKGIISVSEHTKQDILHFYHVPPEKIRVIHLGVNQRFHVIDDEYLRSEFRKQNNLELPYLLYTGNWRDHKNLINLIKAFGLLKRKFHIPHLLVITGKDDPWYPEVKRAVKEERLEGQIRFTGIIPLEDLPLLYNCADLYIFPSLYEGFGLPALEAFACGIPVCASRATSLPEVCGDAAAYFNPRDPGNMAEVIADILTDTVKRESARQKGFERLSLFSWEETAKKTLEVYNEAGK